ncbi:MAG TPA: rod shape-determining protein RodA [Caldilineae bacterium]|nr:rod shape-determining protein RodA [Caldilineae bacterium]
MNERRTWRDFDFILLLAVLLLMVYGVAMIRSATANSPSLQELPRRQAIYGLVGLGVMLTLALIDYRWLCNLQKPIYLVLIGLLLAVDAIGMTMGGAQRWINLGIVPLQPSELTKVLIILVMARFLSDHEEKMRRPLYVLFALVLLAPPVILIYLEPDLGTAISVAVIGGVMILLSGMRVLHIAVLGATGIAALPVIWMSLEDYMRARILLFLHPEKDPAGSYNVYQALISIGSGGLLGKGYGQGTQSQLRFLMVRHTDFIFSVIAEELGFVGAVLLILLILILLFRLIRIAERARDPLGRSIAIGVTTLIFFQSAVNIGMNLRLMPVTGIPLPFVSYGGSSLMTMLMAIGLAESVALHRRKIEF